MHILPIPSQIPVLVIDNFYTPEELNLIWKEINFLTEPNKFKSAEETGAAKEDGKYLKNANGIWLDGAYSDRKVSNILNCNRKIFSDGFLEKAKTINPLYCILENINLDNTLLNYYEDGEEYKKHKDDSVFTAVTMLMKDSNSFLGGDFVIHNFDLFIEKKNNRLVFFPGNLEHSVTPVEMKKPYTPFGGCGRYTITQFMRVEK